MPKALTAERAMILLREVVAGNEDHVYQRVALANGNVCRYLNGGAPSCVVGHVLSRAGFSNLSLARYDGKRLAAARLPQSRVTDDAGYVLDAAQVMQDNGGTWGDALAEAEQAYLDMTL